MMIVMIIKTGVIARDIMLIMPKNFHSDLLFLNASSKSSSELLNWYLRILSPNLNIKKLGKKISNPDAKYKGEASHTGIFPNSLKKFETVIVTIIKITDPRAIKPQIIKPSMPINLNHGEASLR